MTTETEMWRVVVEGGEVREVSTMQQSATMWGAHFVGDTSYNGGYGPSARAAVLAACVSAYVSAAEIVAPGEMTAAERLAVVTAERDDARLMSQCNRDNWRLAGEQRDALAMAVREVDESEGALETMIDDSAWTLDDERAAEERVVAARTALDAALAAAEGR